MIEFRDIDDADATLALLPIVRGLKKTSVYIAPHGAIGSEPPPFNRRYLVSRYAYRIQELVYGG